MSGQELPLANRSWVVVVVTALIAAVPPSTAAVYGYVSKSKELELAKQKQDYDIRMQFLDRAIDPSRSPEARHQVLRFLKTVMTDNAMKVWADQELVSVEKQLREELAQAMTSLQRSQQETIAKTREVEAAKTRLTTAQASNTANNAKISQLHAEVVAAEQAKKQAEIAQRKAEAAVTVAGGPTGKNGARDEDEIRRRAEEAFRELDRETGVSPR